MTESDLENLFQDCLDSVYVISHSTSSVCVYRSGINHFAKFVVIKYKKSIDPQLQSITL